MRRRVSLTPSLREIELRVVVVTSEIHPDDLTRVSLGEWVHALDVRAGDEGGRRRGRR